jgi:hypothetical protein
MRTLIAVLIAATAPAPARADTLRVFPGDGDLVLGHANHCSQATRDELREIVARVPLIMVTERSMILITETFARAFYSKRCDEDLDGVEPRKGAADRTSRRFAWWNEPQVAATLIVILAELRVRRRPVELVLIRRKDPVHPCYERWAGIAEVQ